MTKSNVLPIKVLTTKALEQLQAVFIGFEASNGQCKIDSNLGIKIDAYLNTVTKSDEASYEASKGMYEGTLKEVFEVQLEGESKPSYWKVGLTGKDAIHFSKDDVDKYRKKEWQIANAILLFKLLRYLPINNDLAILGVTGMPTKHSKVEKCRTDLVAGLSQLFRVNGRTFQFTNIGGQAGISVIPQGDGSFYNNLLIDGETGELNQLFLNETAGMTDEDSSIVAEFDLGFLTADVKVAVDYVISQVYRAQLDGVEKKWGEIIRHAATQNDAFDLIRPILLDKQLCVGGELSLDNNRERANVTTFRRKVLEEYAVYLIDSLSLEPFHDLQFTQVRFTGGASIFMKSFIMDYLQEKFKSNPAHIEKFVFEEDSQNTNVKGFRKMCAKKYSKLIAQ